MSAAVAVPVDVITYRGRWADDPDVQRRHRLLRALHELLDSPVYQVTATTNTSGERSINIAPSAVITNEAREFAREHKHELHEAVLDLERERVRREELAAREQKLHRQFDALEDRSLSEYETKFSKFEDTLRQYEITWDGGTQ